MKRLLWEGGRFMIYPWAGFVALVVGIGIAVAVVALLVLPEQRRLAEVRQASSHLQAQLRSQPPAKKVDVAAVYARFPSQSDVPKWLSQIFTSARELNVDLEIGAYSYAKETGTALARYQIELPVTAPYPTVRALIANMLNKMPFAALDDLVITKESPEDEDVNVTMRVSIFVRGDNH